MEREIVLSSYTVKDNDSNKPENFITKFTKPIILDSNKQYAVGLNRIINMSFTRFNVNSDYENQVIKFSKDGGKTFLSITFPAGVWSYKDFDNYIKTKTVVKQGGKPDEYPITLEFDETTFRVTIELK